MSDWTDARVDVLRRMHANGDTFGQIGRALSATRNACIGKAKRLGISDAAPRQGGKPKSRATLPGTYPKAFIPKAQPMPKPAPLELPPSEPVNWQPIATIPKDGRAVIVGVSGRTELGWSFHELPYRVRFAAGRWRYVRYNQPVFDWHKPVRWREDERSLAA